MTENEDLQQVRQLRRSRTERMLSGVCGGIARQFNVDPSIIRLAAVALSIFSGGAGVLLYLAAWIVIPEDE